MVASATGISTSRAGQPSLDDRVTLTYRPRGWSLGEQKWRRLLFLHWEVPAEAVQRRLPVGLTVDTFEGRAYVAITPFVVHDARPWLAPSVPRVSDFLEVNVRTYVHRRGRDPGVWFFSLDASSPLAVLGARVGWRLPYYLARMSQVADPPVIHYQSSRSRPGPVPAQLDVRYRVGEELGLAPPDSLEYFLVERYLLYTRWGRLGLMAGRVSHRAYPLQRAEVTDLACRTMLESVGLPAPAGPPHVLFSPGVDVEVFPLRRAA